MSDASEATKKFQPVISLEEVAGFFSLAEKTHTSTLIWTKDQNDLIESTFTLFSKEEKALYCWQPPTFNPKKFYKELEENNSQECFFSVSLPSANIFFKTTFLSMDTAGLKFKLPDKVFKIQRRANARHVIGSAYSLKIEFKDPLFPETILKKSVLDISAGGLSFTTEKEDLSLYVPGLILKDISFKLKGKSLQFEAEVRHVGEMKDQKGISSTKVGLLFKNITEADSGIIAAYVFEETRKYFSKIL